MNPTQKKLLTELVMLRLAARGLIRAIRLARENIGRFESNRDLARAVCDAEIERASVEILQECREQLIEYRSHLVEIGHHFARLSREVNEHLPRELWLEALEVNRSEWGKAEMLEFGDSPLNVVAVLHLENSATQDDGPESRPLAWCCQMALMNRMQTSSKLDRALHEAANEHFGGIFGEYRERSPLERMGIPASMIQGGDE